MLTLDQIDLPELADMLDQRDQGGYLDPSTGELYPVFDGMIIGLGDGDAVDVWTADTEGLVELGGGSGREVYRDMESFAHAVGDRHVRQQLVNALDGPKPMRAFRTVVHSTAVHSDEDRLGPIWERFGNLCAQVRALDFLGGEHGGERLVSETELDARRAQLLEEADACLAGLGGGGSGRLVLLNGLPGVGKSRLAQEYVATRPGALNLDIDVLRTLIGGPWEETAELGRSLALQLIETHLDSGHEVVVPQLVADPDQLARFEAAAEGREFVMVLVEGESRPGAQPWQEEATPEQVDTYRRHLEDLCADRPGTGRVSLVQGDVARAVADLERLLTRD